MSETPPPYEPPQVPYGGGQPGQPAQPGQPGQPGPYGAPPPPPGYGPYGYGYGPGPVQDHSQATLVLILGIVGLVVCGLVAPFAWVMGNRVVREIDASNGQLGGRGSANAGRILGIIGTAFIALGVLAFVVIVVIAVAGASTSP